MKMKIKSGCEGHAMYNFCDYGPTFGGGHDLCLGGALSLKDGFSKVGYTYERPQGQDEYFLAGNHDFTVAEIEVFQV